ncbi:MAG: hypothetical protein M1836_007037 [Candelina mexicana]|nr:MAG: hypothetical protein M1836_007037 [Candelina mexicana]
MPRAKAAPKAPKAPKAAKPKGPLPYHKRSKDELIRLCHSRGLPHSKKTLKEELAERLEDDDLDWLPESPDMSNFRLFAFPPEVRNRIYDLVFESDQDIAVALDPGAINPQYSEYPIVHNENDPQWCEAKTMVSIPLALPTYFEVYMGAFPSRVSKLISTRRFALLRVNKQIYHEARDRVYSAITVRFDVTASTFGDREVIEAGAAGRNGPNGGFRFVGNDAGFFDEKDLVANMHRVVLKPHARGAGLPGEGLDRSCPHYSESTFWEFEREFVPEAPICVQKLRNVKVVVHLSKGYQHMDEQGYWGASPETMLQPLTNAVNTLTDEVLSKARLLKRLEVQIREVNYPDVPGEAAKKEDWGPVLAPLEKLRGLKVVETAGVMTEEFAERFVRILKQPEPRAAEAAGEDETLVGETSTFVEEGSTLQADDSVVLEKSKGV